MNKVKGATLIELVAFITVIGIAITASSVAIWNTLSFSARPGLALKAANLAMSYMNLMNLERINVAPNTPSDPCTTNPVPDACQSLLTYASNENLSVSATFVTDTNHLTITVNVTGAATATNKTRFPL